MFRLLSQPRVFLSTIYPVTFYSNHGARKPTKNERTSPVTKTPGTDEGLQKNKMILGKKGGKVVRLQKHRRIKHSVVKPREHRNGTLHPRKQWFPKGKKGKVEWVAKSAGNDPWRRNPSITTTPVVSTPTRFLVDAYRGKKQNDPRVDGNVNSFSPSARIRSTAASRRSRRNGPFSPTHCRRDEQRATQSDSPLTAALAGMTDLGRSTYVRPFVSQGRAKKPDARKSE